MTTTGLGIECALRGVLYNKKVSRHGWAKGDYIVMEESTSITYHKACGLCWPWIPTKTDLYAEDYFRVEE